MPYARRESDEVGDSAASRHFAGAGSPRLQPSGGREAVGFDTRQIVTGIMLRLVLRLAEQSIEGGRDGIVGGKA